MCETKTCTKCGETRPATLEYYHKQKAGKLGLNAACRSCAKEYRDVYKATSEYKEKHRLASAKYRTDHPERALESLRKSYAKNGHKHNASRKELYHNDPEYRANRRRRDKQYTESGQRKVISDKARDKLTPAYIATSLRLRARDITPELLTIKRKEICLKRRVKQATSLLKE